MAHSREESVPTKTSQGHLKSLSKWHCEEFCSSHTSSISCTGSTRRGSERQRKPLQLPLLLGSLPAPYNAINPPDREKGGKKAVNTVGVRREQRGGVTGSISGKDRVLSHVGPAPHVWHRPGSAQPRRVPSATSALPSTAPH